MSNHNFSPTHDRFWHRAWQVLKTVQARLRFIAILAVIGAAIVYWDTLKAHYEKWTRPILGEGSAVSSDMSEFPSVNRACRRLIIYHGRLIDTGRQGV